MQNLKDFLEEKACYYNQPDFIEKDPISIPHRFSRREDIEIMGFWTAILSWGQRKTILNKSMELIRLMEDAPYEFIMNHSEEDLKRFLHFKHRTFQPTDTLYFLAFFRNYYQNHKSLEDAFTKHLSPDDENVEHALNGFYREFFSLPDVPHRTRKHISSPMKKASCKRINMFLRWMVRSDNKGVDFGIWKRIRPSQLVIPLDVHVNRVARRLNLIDRKQTNWLTAVKLTNHLKSFDPEDPVKYDFALFGMGIQETR